MHRPTATAIALPAAMLAAAALTGCAATRTTQSSGPQPPPTAQRPQRDQRPHRQHPRRRHQYTARVAAGSSVVAMLSKIRVARAASPAGYDRDEFPHWIRQDGCTTRQDVLMQERRKGRTGGGCVVAHGRWLSAYDGETFTNPSRMDVDHVVPLAEAYVSGADRWSLATRTAYANDLGYAGSLRAVSASSNRQKGALDPARWMPPRAGYACRYVGTWIAIKYRWHLTADPIEMRALRSWVRRCGRRIDVPKPNRARVIHGTIDHAHRHRSTHGPPSRHRHHPRGHGTDPRFATCTQAKAHGYGPYRRGVDPEYHWYRDGDRDGIDCE